ncbi:MAG: glycosyltransferase, partial [Candidatus Bipolaricaulota bacterium]
DNLVEKARGRDDLIVINKESDILVNVLQRASSVVLQKSLKEGFGLTVTEALWKETPVVAADVGGIPLQITDGENGFLVDPRDYEQVADRVVKILQNPELGSRLGRSAHEEVRGNFLITTQLLRWLEVLQEAVP